MQENPVFPQAGVESGEVLASVAALQSQDVRWADGRAFAFVYHANEAVLDVARAAYSAAAATNALSGQAFHSLAQMERDLVGMVGDLLGLPSAHGHVTSGGSESIFLAMKSARDRARTLGVPEPLRVVATASTHPAFDKAAQYLGLEVTRVPVGSGHQVDLSDLEARLDHHTAMVVASAPSYPYGVVEPVAAFAEMARRRGLWLHVDACVGGLLLPFVHELRGTVPPFDFRVDGVVSMSADLHKYGYALKGASLVLYRDEAHAAFQPFRTNSWTGGVYETPNLAGTRPGAPMASAWAVIRYLGRSGFSRLTADALMATDQLIAGIRGMPGFDVPVAPAATLFAFTSEACSLPALAREMRRQGWYLGVQGPPPSIHLTVSPGHLQVVDEFITELRAAAGAVADDQRRADRVEGRYGE